MKKLRQVQSSRRGFSLAETLIAMLIMSFVGIIVTVGMMTALSVYGRITDQANAELLLSTTLIEMRDELDRAEEVKVITNAEDGCIVYYRFSDGNWRKLSNKENDHKGIYLSYLSGYNTQNPQGLSPAKDTEGNVIAPQLLVSSAAASKKLYAQFGGIDYSNGFFTVTDLKVYDSKTKVGGQDKELSSLDSYRIRSLSRVNHIT